MNERIKQFFKNKKVLSYIIICLVTIFACIPLFSKYMNISHDDGIQHICRIIGTNDALKEGNLFPVILSDFCNRFGYSWSIFYSPLTAYLPLIFKLFTSSYTLCLKLFMFTTMLLSGIFMYKLVYKISNSYKASVISAIIYIIAPYHLTDVYNRIAVAELASFVFLPITFLGIYNLFNGSKKTYYIAIGAIGLILSHNVITVYTAIFCLIYLLINYKKLRNKKIIKAIIINILIVLLCTSFYWLPLLEHFFSTTYEVFLPNRMYDLDTIKESKLFMAELFLTKPWGDNFHIGIPMLLGVILAFKYKDKIEMKYKKDVTIFLIFGLASIIMTLRIFPFEHLPRIFRMLQFAWRMMMFASFFLSIVSGITIAMLLNKNKDRNKTILTIIALLIYLTVLVITTVDMTDTPFDEEEYLEPVNLNLILGEIHPGCATFEYLPQKAYSNINYIKKRENKVIILEGTANIYNENKNGTKMTFEVTNINGKVKIELPYIYYLGYTAKITDKDNNISTIKIEESDNGFCMIEVSDLENGKIQISYEGTNLMKISYVLTIIGIIALAVYICINKHNVVK